MENRVRLIAGAIVVVVVVIGVWIWIASGHESTDDAQIEGHVTQVAARVGGTVRRVAVNDNQPVDAGASSATHKTALSRQRARQHGADPVRSEQPAAGHDGGDYFVIADFVDAIRTGQSPIDVIDAVTWSCIRPLSADSITGGSKPVAIPDFSSP